MGTSRSNESSPEWTAAAHVFSGRRDPTWVVPGETIRWLLDRWKDLESADDGPEPPLLGYRGVTLTDPTGSVWKAYGGVVVKISNSMGMRSDPQRSWERAVVMSAPPGLLPKIDFSD